MKLKQIALIGLIALIGGCASTNGSEPMFCTVPKFPDYVLTCVY